MSERKIVRYDRHGRPEYAPVLGAASQRAVEILQAAIDRDAQQDCAALKARQDAGQLNLQERLLSAIFGEIK